MVGARATGRSLRAVRRLQGRRGRQVRDTAQEQISQRFTVFLIWLGIALMLGKVLELGPLGTMSWWWALAPFAMAFVWFEGLEPALGFDKRKKAKEAEDDQARRERIRASFAQPKKS